MLQQSVYIKNRLASAEVLRDGSSEGSSLSTVVFYADERRSTHTRAARPARWTIDRLRRPESAEIFTGPGHVLILRIGQDI